MLRDLPLTMIHRFVQSFAGNTVLLVAPNDACIVGWIRVLGRPIKGAGHDVDHRGILITDPIHDSHVLLFV